MPEREKLLGELRMAVAVTRLIASGDRMLGRGVTPEWERAHAVACDVLRCEAVGIAEADLDAAIAEGATAERRNEARELDNRAAPRRPTKGAHAGHRRARWPA